MSNLTLYTAKVCPYAARAELALQLAGIPHEIFEVNLLDKPSWYNQRINPASKVPVLVEGETSGLHGDQAWKLPESLVIVEYISDLYPTLIFASNDAKFKATSRYVVERYGQIVQPHYISSVLHSNREGLEALKKGLREFNELIDSFEGKFLVGGDRFGYADLNIAPFVARILSASKNGFIKGKEGESSIHKELEEGEGLERVKLWWEAVEQVEVWKKVWNEEKYLEPLRSGLAARKRKEAEQAKV